MRTAPPRVKLDPAAQGRAVGAGAVEGGGAAPASGGGGGGSSRMGGSSAVA